MANELALLQKDITDSVEAKIASLTEQGQLHIPPDYSMGNALKSGFLIAQDMTDINKKPVLEVCDKNSIANTFFNMVVQGLNPAKNQCYFIAYGGKLTLQRSYFGEILVTKRFDPRVSDIAAQEIYEDDVFNYRIQDGKKYIVKHEQSFVNRKKEKIIGAYAIVVGQDGEVIHTEVMTMDEIRQAWGMGFNSPITKDGLKPGSTHEKFTQEMAKKTVIKRACKTYINSSSDQSILIDSYRETEKEEYESLDDVIADVNSREVKIVEDDGFDQPKQENVPKDVVDVEEKPKRDF